MAYKYHNVVTLGDVHRPDDIEYANQAARLAGAGITSDQVGHLVQQTDNESFWIVTGSGPATFSAFTPPAPAVGDIGKSVVVESDGAGGVRFAYDAGGSLWSRTGIILSPQTAGDTIALDTHTATSGNVISAISTPASGSTAVIANLEAQGANWSSGSRVIKITTDDNQAVPLVVNDGASDTLYLTRTGLVQASAGSVGSPSLTTFGDPDTGLYSSASDELSFTLGGSQKFIIAGVDAYTGTGTATTGAPRLFLGTNASSGDDSALLIGRAIDGASLFSHAIRDESTFETTGTGAYASYDSDFSVGGTQNYNHFNSFQCRYDWTGSGTVTDAMGFTWQPTLDGTVTAASAFQSYLPSGTGTITNLYGLRQRSGSRSNVTNYYGLHIDNVTGPTNKWAIYTNGSNPSYFGGFVGCGDSTPNTILSSFGDKTAPTVFQDSNFGQIDISQTGAVNKVMKLSFSSTGYMGNSCAAIGCETTGAGSFLYLGTTNTGGGLSNTALTIDPSGDTALSGDLTLTGGGSITTTSNGDITLLPNGTGVLMCGTGSPGHLTPTSGEAYFQGQVEIDGTLWTDGSIQAAGSFVHGSGQRIYSSFTSGGTIILRNSSQTPDCMTIATGSVANYHLICEYDDRNFDWALPQQTTPTLAICGATQNTTHILTLAHNDTDGVIDCLTGTLNLGGTANVNFAGATRTASTVTHDAYVELEVAGTLYKFMLGS